jgi:trehalose-6-phosphatase
MRGERKPYPSQITTNLKKLNFNYENVYNLYSGNENVRLSKGLNSLLKSTIMSNLGVEITIKGQMFRKSGKFITIDTSALEPKNNFDDRFLGTYFIINIDHSFIKDDTYINKIFAIKTYYFDNIKFNENLD